MPTPLEIAYDDLVRGLNGQATDLESIRSHVNVALGAGGVAAAFLAGKSGSTIALWIAFGSFVLICLITAFLYKSVTAFTYDFVQDDLTSRFGKDTSDEALLRYLLDEGVKGYGDNRAKLDAHWRAHNGVLILFALEIVALLIHAA
jgi:hypothetical protein